MSRQGLHLERIRFAYADSDWRLSIPKLAFGQERIVAVAGPNGSGKSTLLRLAAGILPCQNGAVHLDDTPLHRMARRDIARRIGFLPQEEPPLFDCSVKDIVCMGRYAHTGWIGALTEADQQAVREALEAVDLMPLRRRKLSHLSGGERRRALIASVLAQQPDLLFLDEPTAALDIHHAVAVMRLLAGLRGTRPAVVMVTHDLNLASLFADRLLLLQDGQLVEDGPPSDVLTAQRLREVYGDGFLLQPHPETGGPVIIPSRSEGEDAHDTR